MNEGKYILVDGTFEPASEFRLMAGLAHGFLFSEAIRATRTRFPFFDETLELIKLKLKIFNHAFPDFTEKEGTGLKRQLERTMTKNKLFQGALFRISFYSENQSVHYTIQSWKIEQPDFSFNERGLFLGLFDKVQKSVNILSNLSLGSLIHWQIASSHLGGSGCDLFLITNTEDLVIEVPFANIYLISGRMIRGASVEQGAYLDISQSLLLDVFDEMKLDYREDLPMTVQDIVSAEEIMVVNAVDGIRWVLGFEGKRYFNNTIRKISERFNQLVSVK